MVARQIHRLTAVKVRHVGPGVHPDGGGLYLQVTERGRSWLFRFTSPVSGRDRWMGLGPVTTVSLAEARQAVAYCRQQVRDNIDPIKRREEERERARLTDVRAMTFDQCRDAYIASHSAAWRSTKHGFQWKQSLEDYVSPIFGSLPVQAIDVALVMKALEPVWSVKPTTASRVRGRIEVILDWATVRGYRSGENPAAWRGRLSHLLPARSRVHKVEHHAAMPYDGLGTFLVSLRARDGIAARALEFLILTAARTGEVSGARWEEIDLAAKVWTVPASRMKAGRQHRVPLSDAALAVLNRVPREVDRVFPINNMSLPRLIRRMGRRGLTVHGFRSSFRDWAAEVSHFPREIAEAALAHLVGDDTERAYRRGDLFEKRRLLMAAWAEFCSGPSAEGVVVPFRAAE
jgi:integrase